MGGCENIIQFGMGSDFLAPLLVRVEYMDGCFRKGCRLVDVKFFRGFCQNRHALHEPYHKAMCSRGTGGTDRTVPEFAAVPWYF